jgi:hypothetical protein
MSFTHNSKTSKDEGDWASVDKNALPDVAFCPPDADRKYPHHWVEGGGNKDKAGHYTTGTMYLHRQGLGAALAAAHGARSGQEASPEVISHLEAHEKAIKDEKKNCYTRQVPRKALNFLAECEFSSNGPEAKTAPVKMLARTGDPIPHWFWGPNVHDMQGMKHKNRIVIDYNHDEVIGYANKFDTSTGDLYISGVVQSTKPDDRAAEVIERGPETPYEASINFGDSVVVEELPEGQMVNINGRQLQGPLTIFRDWTLRGVAVCPYGADKNTSSTFSDDENDLVTINYMEKEKLMNTENEIVVETKPTELAVETKVNELAETVETEKVEAVVEAVAEVAEVKDEVKDVKTEPEAETKVEEGEAKPVESPEPVEPVAELSQPVVVEAPVTELSAKEMELTQIISELQKEKEELQNRLSALAEIGEKKVSFAAETVIPTDVNGEKYTKYKTQVSDGIARFAASLKI